MNRLDCGSSGHTIMLSVKCVPFSGLHLPACCCELQHSDIAILAALVKANAQTEFIKMARKTSLDIMHLSKFHRAPCELHTLRPLPFLCCLTVQNSTMCKAHTHALPPHYFLALLLYIIEYKCVQLNRWTDSEAIRYTQLLPSECKVRHVSVWEVQVGQVGTFP